MSEQPYFPVIQLRRVANGWVVSPSPRFDRDQVFASLEETYVFSEWEACEKFMSSVTVPTRNAE